PGNYVRRRPGGCRAPAGPPACRPQPGVRRRTAPRLRRRPERAAPPSRTGCRPLPASAGPTPAALLFSLFRPWLGSVLSCRLVRPRRMAAVLAALALAFILAAPAVARQQAPAEPVLSAEGISEYALDNGMRVVLFPDSSKPVTTVNVTYLVGSRHENYGETG